MRILAVTLFLLSAAVTLVVLQAARPPAGAAEGRGGPGAGQGGAAAESPATRPPSLSDFRLEEPQVGESGPYLLRPPTPRWSDQQVERYWIPLQEVILDIVSARSDQRIEEIFQDIE